MAGGGDALAGEFILQALGKRVQHIGGLAA